MVEKDDIYSMFGYPQCMLNGLRTDKGNGMLIYNLVRLVYGLIAILGGWYSYSPVGQIGLWSMDG